MSNWSESTFKFVRRTPRSISTTGSSTPAKDEHRQSMRVDTPRPPPIFPNRQLSMTTRPKSPREGTEEIGSGANMADAKVNVTTFCANREVQLKETERKLDQAVQDNEKLKQELNQTLLQATRLEEFNQQLQKTCNQFEDRLTRCESYYQEIQSDYDEACKALELAESIRVQMSGAFEELKTKIIDDVRNRTKAESDAEIQKLTQLLQEAEKMNGEAKMEWQRRAAEWTKAEETNGETLKQAKSDREWLQRQLSETTAALSMLVQDKNECQQKLEGALNELNQLKRSYQQEVNSKVGNTLNELQTERSILTTVRKKLADKEEQSAQLLIQVQQLNEQLCECRQHLELLEREKAELNAQLQIRDSRIFNLENEGEKILSERNRLLETVSKNQEQLAVITNQYESASLACAEAREAAKDLTKEKLNLQDELVSVSQQLEKYREDVDLLQAENSRLEEKLQSVNELLESRTNELTATQILVDEEKQRNEHLSSHCSELEAEHDKQASLLIRLEAADEQLRGHLDQQEKVAEGLRSELKIEKEALERADKEVVDLRENLVEKDRILMEKTIELEYKNRRIDALTEANEKLEQEVAERRECLPDRSHSQLETSVRENQSRIQELVIKLDRQKEQEKKAVAKLKYELQLARESQERAESKAAEAEAAAADLRHRLSEASDEEEALKKKMADLENQLKSGKAPVILDVGSTSLSATCRPEERPQFHEIPTDEESPAPRKSVTFKDPNKELLAKIHQLEAKAADEKAKSSAKRGSASESHASSQIQAKDSASKRKRRLHSDKPPAQPLMIEASPVLKAGPPRSYGRTRSTAYPTGSKSECSSRSSLSSLDDKEFK